MTTIRRNDEYIAQVDNDKTRIVRATDNKKTKWNSGQTAKMEIAKIKQMKESEFCFYCRGLLFY